MGGAQLVMSASRARTQAELPYLLWNFLVTFSLALLGLHLLVGLLFLVLGRARGLLVALGEIVFSGAFSYWLTDAYAHAERLQGRDSPALSWRDALVVGLVYGLPRRLVSRMVGRIAAYRIPGRGLREALFSWLCRRFGARVGDIVGSLGDYESLTEFFSRPIRLELREEFDCSGPLPIVDKDAARGRLAEEASQSEAGAEGSIPANARSASHASAARDLRAPGFLLFSPADSVFSYLGDFSESSVEAIRVKGLRYSCSRLLTGAEGFSPRLAAEGASSLYQAVFYLSPGDYHRFHSPADILVREYRVLGGDLLPVNALFMPRVAGLLAENERAVLSCEYSLSKSHPRLFCGVAAVGALNVGSVSLRGAELGTNKPRQANLSAPGRSDRYAAGEELGTFHLGSTVVVVFEVPEGYGVRAVGLGEHVLVGSPAVEVFPLSV